MSDSRPADPPLSQAAGARADGVRYFTSVNVNYLAKARVLAASVKRHCKNAFFSLVLYEAPPDDFDLRAEPFDELVTLQDLRLPVPNLDLWIYLHNVVELGTAVKGQALLNFLQESRKVVYLDPDIVVYHSLDELDALLDTYAVVLTPHQLAPDRDKTAIWHNELGSMLRGTFNFGFFAANNSPDGIAFAVWFRDRLLEYCYDDVKNGLFTDQRWGNLVPAMFDGVYIWRNPGCNVSTWNITRRTIAKNAEGDYLVNGEPLLFYHFSGFDSGAQLSMVKLFGNGNPVLYELRDAYGEQLKQAGQETLAKRPFMYNRYSDGKSIPSEHRVYLREHPEVLSKFEMTNPFDVGAKDCYRAYYQKVYLRSLPTLPNRLRRFLVRALKAPFCFAKRALRALWRKLRPIIKKIVMKVLPGAGRSRP